MDLGATLVVELLALGAAVGFLAGLLGIGGGMVMVPIMTLLLTQRGVPAPLAVKMSIATSMATIMFTSLSSVRAHHRLGAVRWEIARAMAPGIVTGGLLAGAGAFALLKGQGLALLFAAFIGYSALKMMRNTAPRPGRQLPGAWAQAGVGVGIGFASALLGAGGAFMSVPFMTWCNVPPRQAVATAAAIGFPIALASTAGYLISGRDLAPALPGAFGYLYLPALAVVSVASVTLAPVGARTAQRIDVTLLKRLFALMLLALAASMLRQAFAT
ncbi:putative membrane transporter protein [Rubrivivax sp. A210]|uniref:sulfite exporter TauE/SafE family protein n=1 Tax=Rubrivivax sp. A210 TaxID=2772301 RepID=UPI0019186756|nr:sulfite exporter TauE/SafE family protein [Rubrivivax sp. A210]CAD5374499.1 putative membrane transporter protein [Rubrivivax sp. A210]